MEKNFKWHQVMIKIVLYHKGICESKNDSFFLILEEILKYAKRKPCCWLAENWGDYWRLDKTRNKIIQDYIEHI